ncbi:LCP family protein [Aminicella lysinilytica]|uniref:LytR family transcriptional attenuator n=1 Tax=Aminicella lysinilytica TaxID=433323 RepID=A0A4R6QDP7_9FIRM|nr:LCP family protein [Aminicella lysinilytica]NLD10879.1 LCP family protein [Clostridiales bacterium]TDP60515.1 LytR family transcriptional attenuator [Aminicella lysinilytica]
MSRRTVDLGEDVHYSPEVIRKYEDPEFAKASEKYEREARRRKNHGGKHSRKPEKSFRSDDSRRASRSTRNNGGYGGGSSNSGHHGNSGHGSGSGTRTRWNPGKFIRNLIIILAILFIAFCGYFLYMTSHLDKADTSDSNFAINSQVASDLKGYRNIAILGVDARANEGYDGSRTDAIIIMSIKKSNGDIKLISVMRDSYLKMNENGTLTLDKITHAHAYGGGTDTCAALNRSLDLNISEFVIFNWKAVADTVDALGGITVDVKQDEISDLNQYGKETARNVGGTYTKITTTGKQTIDGVQAATYCRIRKTSGGDSGRANRYKKVMSAVMKKAITSPLKLNTLAKEVLPEIRTNMSQAQLLTAVLRAPGYDIKKNISWPKSYYGGLVGGVWYAVPTTLSSNVQWLHAKAFAQTNYTPTTTCLNISNEIISSTGIQ